MRLKIWLAGLLTLLPLPALADVTARYAAGPSIVTVEAADNGDSRFEIDAEIQLWIIRHDGVDYAVTRDSAGVERVTRADGVMAVLFSTQNPPPYPRFDAIEGGPGTLAGYPGTLWRFGPHGEEPVELLMSSDPRLVPVGNVFRQLVALLAGAANTEVDADAFRQMFARGTPLRIESVEQLGPDEHPQLLIALESVGFSRIDPVRFALPGPVIPAEDFVKLLPSLVPGTASTRTY